MGSYVRWFVTSFGLAFGSAAGIAASASVGDLVYEAQNEQVEISVAEALCYSDCAISAGSWDPGARTRMVKTCAFRAENSSTGFAAFTRGLKTAAPEDLPDGGALVVGIVE